MSSLEDCIFCSKKNCKIIKSTKFFFIIRDTAYPVTKHHTLIITNRHVSSYFDLDKDEIDYLSIFQLISIKPVVYVCNVDENSSVNGNSHTKSIEEYSKLNNSETLLVSAKIESEISQISDNEEKKMFLDSMGLKETGLKRVIKKISL